MIPTELIDRALALTDRTMEDMKEMIDEIDCETNNSYFKKLSIEKFCYYLLSPDFIENFTEIRAKSMEKLISENLGNKVKMARQPIFTSGAIGESIYEYQKGNEQLLISLLSKI